MHYKNGRPAQVGDLVVGEDWQKKPVAGIVTGVMAGSDTCNLYVLPYIPTNVLTLNAKDCLHKDDLEAKPYPGDPVSMPSGGGDKAA